MSVGNGAQIHFLWLCIQACYQLYNLLPCLIPSLCSSEVDFSSSFCHLFPILCHIVCNTTFFPVPSYHFQSCPCCPILHFSPTFICKTFFKYWLFVLPFLVKCSNHVRIFSFSFLELLSDLILCSYCLLYPSW